MKKRVTISKRSFSLAELLIAMTLVGLLILAVTSVSITSYRFFGAAKKESRILDEAKIAMEHIVKSLQLGIGDLDEPGFVIFDAGAPAPSGPQIRVRLDDDGDGKFTGSPEDKTVVYNYNAASHRVLYDPDFPSSAEPLTDNIVTDLNFNTGTFPNQVVVTITVLEDPGNVASLDNPETTLTSSVVLRAMSIN